MFFNIEATMNIALRSLGVIGVGLVGCLASAGAQTESLIAVVKTSEPMYNPVPHENVMVESAGLGPFETSDTGKFQFPLTNNLKVGHPAIFRVAPPKDKRWVIVRPCDLKNGRKDSLPDVSESPMEIIVVLWGSPELKRVYVPGCIIEELASQFKPKSGEGRGSVLLHNEQPEGLAASSPKAGQPDHVRTKYDTNTARHLSLLNVAYRSQSVANSSGTTPERPADTGDLRVDEFLTSKAAELGLTAKDLRDMVDQWRLTAGDSYEKGLAAFYEGRFSEAGHYISESIKTSTGDTLKEYVLLARVEYEQGHYVAAESALRTVLSRHGDDPLILNDLGVVLSGQADYLKAEPFFKQALTIEENALGSEHPTVATTLNNLAELFRKEAKYADAGPLYERALAIQQKVFGRDGIELAVTLNNLGLLRAATGDFAEAESFYERALAIDKKAFGSEHPDVARGLNNLAEVYRIEGKYEKAVPLCKQALAIVEKSLGPAHPHVATVLSDLGLLYRAQRKYREAEPLYKRALAIDETALGPEHPDVALRLNNLAVLYRAEGRYEEAEPLYKRALAIDQKALGPEHPMVATNLTNLATLYRVEGRYEDAETLYKQGLAIAEKALGPEHPTVAALAENLATFLRELGRDKEAKHYEEQAAQIRDKWK